MGATRGRGTRFGQEGGELSYGTYLKVTELLGLQQLASDPPAHDELLFIVIHQTFELWFKQILFELETARDAMFAGDVRKAVHVLRRVGAIERVLVEQIPVLESMSPQDFLEFRSNLAPASGFQSVQFRELEFLSGLKEPGLISRLAVTEEEAERLRRRLDEPTVWDAFCALLGERGLPMPADDAAARQQSLLRVAWEHEAFDDLWTLAEELLTHDELVAMWRMRHVLMVERQIGSKTGTGGSTGATYLRSTLDKRFYPDLWDLRSHL